ncbi:MAG: HAD-IA family hydrolase [Pseudomonadota bacterium]
MQKLPKQPSAIFFGSIGTLVDTSQMQLDAFNEAFRELETGWHWTKSQYVSMLSMSGGKKRIAHYAQELDATVDVEEIHTRKTQIYNDMMRRGGLTPRPGVKDLISAAQARGVPVAFVTDTYQDNIDTMFECLNGTLAANDFAWVGCADRVDNRKPDPEIYAQALSDLSVRADEVVAIEDTSICLKAPLAAGISTIAFPNSFAGNADMNGAAMTVDRLDPKWVAGEYSAIPSAA